MGFVTKITSQEIEHMECIAFPGSIHVISSEGEDFDEAVNYLKRQRVIGFDTVLFKKFQGIEWLFYNLQERKEHLSSDCSNSECLWSLPIY